MGPSNPSRTRVLPSWMKKVKSSKSVNVASSTSLFLDSSEPKELASTLRENPTDVEQADRIFHDSTFVPRNTVLFVMSERELLETAKLILEEDDHSPSPVIQPENIDAIVNDKDGETEKEQQHIANPCDMHSMLNSAKTKLNHSEKSNNETSSDRVNHKWKHHLKRRHDGSAQKTNDNDDMDYEDAMEVEASPVVSPQRTNPNPNPQRTNNECEFTSGLFAFPHKNNKDSLPNQKMDAMTSSSNLTPIPKKRLKPNLSILDEIFF